jgi:hypothetical protein
MQPRRARALALGALLVSAACGGKVGTGDPADSGASNSRDSSPSSSGSGSGSGQTFGVCPAEAPNLGDPCVMPNQGCVYLYGNGGCVAYVCDGSNHWVSSNEGC